MNKDYTTYKTEDFLNDESFIDWARFSQKDSEWESISQSDLINSNALEEAKTLIQSIHFKEHESTQFVKSKVWSKIQSDISEEAIQKPKSKSQSKTLWMSIAAIAAIGLLAVILYPTSSDTNNIYKTKIGEHQLIALEDGSAVDLNVNSEFTVEYTDSTRNIDLYGEAYFDVEKGNPFSVQTENGTISVLGTTFNVRSRDKQLIVDCYSGSVQVKVKGSEQQAVLEAGESCGLINGILRLTRHKTQKSNPEWQESFINFEGQSLEDVLLELTNYHELFITYEPEMLKFKRFTGKVQTDDLEKSIQSITWPLSLEHRLIGSELTIYKKEETEKEQED